MKEAIRQIHTLQDMIDQFFCAKVHGGIYISKFPLKAGEPIDTLEKAEFISNIREFHYSVLEIREHLLFMISADKHPGSVIMKRTPDTPVTDLLTKMFYGHYNVIRDDVGTEEDVRRMAENTFVNDPATFNRLTSTRN